MKRFLYCVACAGVLQFADASAQTNCPPGVDAFLADVPWFPLNNSSAPMQKTPSELIQEVKDTATNQGWTIELNPVEMLDVYCARAYDFVPRGEYNDSAHAVWMTLDLKQMTSLINRCKARVACGGIAKYANTLVCEGVPDMQADYLSFGQDRQIHTVSLWTYKGVILYYDAMKNITLAKPGGDTIDFRNAFDYIINGKYDSVIIKPLPEYFGPEWSMHDPQEIKELIGNYDYDSAQRLWPADYKYSFDSSWFCTADSALSLGAYCGNAYAHWLKASEKPTDGQQILDYIENHGYARKLVNWWRISPETSNAALQTFIESRAPANPIKR